MKEALLFLSIFLLLSCSEDKHRQAMNLYEQGKAQEERGAVDSAVITYNEVINLLEQTSNKSLYGDIYNRLGDVYLNNNLETDALKVFQIALRYNLALSDKTKASYSLRGMGKSYAYRLKPDSALYYHLKASKLIPHIKDSDEIANVYNNLSNDYFELNNYDSALIYVAKAISLNKDSLRIYSNYSVKGNVFMANHQYDSAYIYFKKGVLSPYIYTRATCYFHLSEIAKQTGDSNYAKYLEIYHSLNDSIDLQNQGIKIVKAEKYYTKDSKSQLNIFSIIWLIGFVITGAVCIYFAFRYYKKKINKASKLLEENEAYLRKTQVQLASLLANIKEAGELCRKRFMQSKEYSVIENRLRIDTILSYDEQAEYCSFLSVHFDSYIKSLQNIMTMSDDDCYLCCLFLSGFKTKHCANFRSITTNGLRTQKGRIFQKIKQIFGVDITFENFFGLPEKQVKSAKNNMISCENEAEK